MQTPPHQGQYAIDGGQTWSDIRGLPDNIASWYVIYNEASETWYASYTNNTKGIVFSKNGMDWHLLFEPTPTSFTGETKLISTHAEDDTSEYVLGYFFIVNGKDIHRFKDYILVGTAANGDYYSTDGKTWTKGSITTSTRINSFGSTDTTFAAIGKTR